MAQGNIGVLYNNLRGKAGSVVFARSKDGTVIKPRISPRNPRTAAQVAVRAALSKAATQYKGLTSAQVQEWFNYAQSITKHDSRTGKTYHPAAITAFTELGAKFYAVDPSGTAPTDPPGSSFLGDTITITCSHASGKVTFHASAANGTDITTELMLQPLLSANRKPQPKGYRTKAYNAFATGSLSFDITVPAGWYVPAFEFVDSLTGQVAGFKVLPVVQVS